MVVEIKIYLPAELFNGNYPTIIGGKNQDIDSARAISTQLPKICADSSK
jgi:hypothetical protein